MVFGTSEAKEAWKQAEAEVARLAKAMRETDGPSKSLQNSFQKARENASSLKGAFLEQQKELHGLKASLRGLGIDVGRLGEAERRLKNETEALKRSLEEGSRLNAFRKMLDIRPVREIEAEIKKLEHAYKELKKSGKLSAVDLARAQAKLKGRVKELRQETNALHRTMGLFSRSTKAFISGFAGFVAVQQATGFVSEATRVYAEFDDAVRAAGAAAGANAEEMGLLAQAAKKMGETTRFSATEFANALKFLAMAGLDVKESIDALPGMLQLAAAGQMDLADAADIATNIMTGYGMSVKDLARVNDILVQTATNSNTSIKELGYAFSYAEPIAKAAGLEFDETATILGLLANAGYKGERAGTALRGALSRLLDPSKEVAVTLNNLGVNVRDSNGRMRSMLDILKDLKARGATATQIIKIFGQEAGPAMAALIGMSVREIDALKNKIDESGGAARRVSEQMEAGLGGALRTMKSRYEALLITIGEAIDKDGDLVAATIRLTEWMTRNKGEIASVAVKMSELAAGFIDGARETADFVAKNRELIVTFTKMVGLAYAFAKGLQLIETLRTSQTILGLVQSLQTYGGVIQMVQRATALLKAYPKKRENRKGTTSDEGISFFSEAS